MKLGCKNLGENHQANWHDFYWGRGKVSSCSSLVILWSFTKRCKLSIFKKPPSFSRCWFELNQPIWKIRLVKIFESFSGGEAQTWRSISQWLLFLVPLKGGRDYIIPQLAGMSYHLYTTYSPCLPPFRGTISTTIEIWASFGLAIGHHYRNRFAGLTHRSQRGFLAHPDIVWLVGAQQTAVHDTSGVEVLTCGLKRNSILRIFANLTETTCPQFLSSSIHAFKSGYQQKSRGQVHQFKKPSTNLTHLWLSGKKTSIIQLHAGNKLLVVSSPNCSAAFKTSPCNQYTPKPTESSVNMCLTLFPTYRISGQIAYFLNLNYIRGFGGHFLYSTTIWGDQPAVWSLYLVQKYI